MLMRAVSVAALGLSLSFLSSGALAGSQSGLVHRVSCKVVRYYVARYSASTAEMWARSHGASDAEIEAARRCLRDEPERTAEATRWFWR
jgi:hypothetical protein